MRSGGQGFVVQQPYGPPRRFFSARSPRRYAVECLPTLGEYGVNISRMVTSSRDNNVSRDSIMLLGLDKDVPQEAIDRCLEMDEIYEMKIIDF